MYHYIFTSYASLYAFKINITISKIKKFEECFYMQELDFSFIGQRIKEIRTGKKLTQESLANITGVNVSHISNIETNKVKVSLTLLVQICNALDITIDYLLENEYHDPVTVVEKELVHVIRSMQREKQETLLRIAKVL